MSDDLERAISEYLGAADGSRFDSAADKERVLSNAEYNIKVEIKPRKFDDFKEYINFYLKTHNYTPNYCSEHSKEIASNFMDELRSNTNKANEFLQGGGSLKSKKKKMRKSKKKKLRKSKKKKMRK